MSDIKIGDKVVGIKGATRVAGIVMNIKEGHVHIKSPVAGVYAPVVSIVPMHKVTKLGEGAMKRKAEDEDDGGMSDYTHDAQTSKPDASEVARDKAKKANISAADKDKLSKVKNLLNKEETAAVTNKNQEHAVHVDGQPITAYPNAHQAQRVGLKLKDMLGKKTVSVHHMAEEVKPYVSKSKKNWDVIDHAGKTVFSHEHKDVALYHLKKNYDKYRDPKHLGESDKSGLTPEQIARRKKMDAIDFANRRKEMNSKRQAGTAPLRTTYREEVQQIDELNTGKKLGAAAVRLGKGAAAAALHVASTPLAGLSGFPGNNAVKKVGDASLKFHHKAYDAAKKHLGKGIKNLGRALEESHSIVNNLKADGKHEEAGAKAFEHGLGRKYGQHFGLRSTKNADEMDFHKGYDKAEMRSKKKVDEEVDQINEKSMYKNQAVKMTAHTEKDGKAYKGTHTVILKKVPTLDTPTIQAQTKERAEKSLKAHLKSRGHKVTGIEHLGEGYNSARTQGTAYGRRDISGKGSFKSREHEFEAGVEAQHSAAQAQHDSEPHHVYINRKVMKDKVSGEPVNFSGKNHAKAVAAKLIAKYPNMQVHTVHHSYTAQNGGVIPSENK